MMYTVSESIEFFFLEYGIKSYLKVYLNYLSVITRHMRLLNFYTSSKLKTFKLHCIHSGIFINLLFNIELYISLKKNYIFKSIHS